MTPRIVHVDMDAFYASVEEREHPELAGKPVAVIATARRGAVMTANYVARAFGVRSALPVHFALERCPNLILLPARLELYREVSRAIHAVFERFTDLIEPLSLDEAYLDLSAGTADLSAAEEQARAIKAGIRCETRLSASAGVSENKFLAKLASGLHKPDGLTVIRPGDVDALLANLPVEAFHGIGPVTARKLRRQGVADGSALRAQSRSDLVAWFGRHGEHFHDIARGLDERRVEAHREAKSVGVERTFDADLREMADMHAVLPELAAEVAARLRARNLAGRTVTLKVRFPDWTLVTRRTTGPESLWKAADLARLASALLRGELLQGRGVRLLGVTVSTLSPMDGRSGAQTLFPGEDHPTSRS